MICLIFALGTPEIGRDLPEICLNSAGDLPEIRIRFASNLPNFPEIYLIFACDMPHTCLRYA